MTRGTTIDGVDAGQPKPGLFYGWVVLGVTILATICTSPGQTYVVGLFNEPIRDSLGIDLERLTLAYLYATFAASLPLGLVGRVADRIGVRMTTVGVGLGLVGACLAIATASGFLSVLVAFFLLRFLGQGSLGLLASHSLAMWFERRLSFVEGLRHGSFSVAIAILPPAVVASIAFLGWRETYWVFAGVVLVFTLLAGILLRNRPEDIGQHLDNDSYEHQPGESAPRVRPDDPAFTLLEAISTRAFWIIGICSTASGLIGTAFLFHTSGILEDLGSGTELVGFMVSAWGVSLGVVLFGGGAIVDRVSPRWSLFVSMTLLGLSALCFSLAGHGAWVGIAAMLIFGISQGILFLVAGPTTARFFGRTHHGAIRGLQTTLSVAGTSVGPYLFAVVLGSAGSFVWALWGSAIAGGMLAAGCLLLRPPSVPER